MIECYLEILRFSIIMWFDLALPISMVYPDKGKKIIFLDLKEEFILNYNL